MTDLAPQNKKSRSAMLVAIVVILILALLFHPVATVLGITLAVTGLMWGVLVASVVLFCVIILLSLLFSGAGVLLLGLIGLVWVVAALIFFPVLFPILLPLLIIMLVIGLIRRWS